MSPPYPHLGNRVPLIAVAALKAVGATPPEYQGVAGLTGAPDREAEELCRGGDSCLDVPLHLILDEAGLLRGECETDAILGRWVSWRRVPAAPRFPAPQRVWQKQGHKGNGQNRIPI